MVFSHNNRTTAPRQIVPPGVAPHAVSHGAHHAPPPPASHAVPHAAPPTGHLARAPPLAAAPGVRHVAAPGAVPHIGAHGALHPVRAPGAPQVVPVPTGVPPPATISHALHDAAATKHGVPSTVPRFFCSSFDFIKAPPIPVHAAFVEWAKIAGPAYTFFFWRLDNGHILPFAVQYEVKSGSQIDYLTLSPAGDRVVHVHIADLSVVIEKHMLSSNKEILMLHYSGTKTQQPVRGTVFRPKGGSTMFPSKGDPGVHLLTQGFTSGGGQSIWEVQNDKSLLISEQAGAHKVGIITAEDSVHGYVVQGPVSFAVDSNAAYSEEQRNEFIVHVLLALTIMPVHRPANMTKALWWLRKLGGIALEEAQI